MASKHDAKRAAKKHAKEKKRKAELDKRRAKEAGRAAADRQPVAAPRQVVPDPELDPIFDAAEDAANAGRWEQAVAGLLALDTRLEAEGHERFVRADLLEPMARLWGGLQPGERDGAHLAGAANALRRLLPFLDPSDDLEMWTALELEKVLFRLGRGAEALERILLKPKLTADDLDNATNAVLDSEFATKANIRQVRDACERWQTRSQEDVEMRQDCLSALDEALAAASD